MPDRYETEISQYLESAIGDRAVDLPTLMTELQNELRQIARRQRRGNAVGETLSTTALINEAYLRFASAPALFAQIDRTHFLAIAARSMRHIVINHVRDQVAQKRGAGARHETLGALDAADPDLITATQILELNDALERLERIRPRLAQVVQLRYFGGLTEDETGAVLGLDRSTVRRDWTKARGWLFGQLHPDDRA